MRCVLRTHSTARARTGVQLRDTAVKTFSSVKLIEAVNPEIYLDAAPDAINTQQSAQPGVVGIL